MKRILFILILGVIAGNSCAPVAMDKGSTDTQIKFEPTLQDRELPWDKIEANKEIWFLPPGESFVMSGARLMNMFENMMFLGDSLDDIGVRHKAHDYVRSFYGVPANTTTPKVEQSLYLEAALGEKKQVLLNLLNNKKLGLQNTVPALQRTVPKVKAGLGNINSLPLSGLAPAIQAMLDNFVLVLEAEGGFRLVWKELKTQIDSTYRDQIAELGQALSQISPNKKVQENTKYMRTVLKLPLKQETIKAMTNQINQIDNIANRLDHLDSSYEGMKVLLEIWLMLDDQARQKTFGQFNWALYKAMNFAGDQYIFRLKENRWDDLQQWDLTQITIRRGLQGIIKYYGVQKLRETVLPEMQKAVPEALK